MIYCATRFTNIAATRSFPPPTSCETYSCIDNFDGCLLKVMILSEMFCSEMLKSELVFEEVECQAAEN
jgi:hypothetical protein